MKRKSGTRRFSRWVMAAGFATCLSANHVMAEAETGAVKDGTMILENDLLRVEVSPIGARIVSLYDKVREREDVKNLPNVGGLNEVRINRTLGLNELRDRYALHVERLADGTQRLTGSASFEATEEQPAAGTVIKEIALAPGSSCLQLAFEVRNDGDVEIGLIPWMRNLLLRPEGHHPEEAHMTEHGAYLSGRPLPADRDGRPPRGDPHFYPAANWSSRVITPVDAQANLMAVVTRPGDMFKLYNWHRGFDFSTLEVIAQPFFAPPGERFRWDTFMLWGPPVRNLVYASPELLIGVSPHPTWLESGTSELALDFASTHSIEKLEVEARLVDVDRPGEAIQTFSFTLDGLSPRGITRQSLPVSLEDGTARQLRLAFSSDGKPFVPGAAAGDEGNVIIPLVVDRHVEPPIVYPRQTEEIGRLRRIEPKVRTARQVYTCDAFDAFAWHPASRVFRRDTFRRRDTGPLQLDACAGEFVSRQLVLTPKSNAPVVLEAGRSALTGMAGAEIACDAINEFIYVETETPSHYNARYPVGEYPEALLPVGKTTLAPDGNHPLFVTWKVPRGTPPGPYRGAIVLSRGETRHEIPVELTVWNVEVPLYSPTMEFASSLKGHAIPGARRPDGTPYTREEQLEAIENMHLEYRLTPCDSGVAALLLNGNIEAFEKKMQRFIDAGATKIYLGNSRQLIEQYGARIPEIETYLEEKGWINHFYVRPGFDEIASDQVHRVRDVLVQWKNVSSIPTMETYYHDAGAPELFGLLDIWARSSIGPLFDERIAAGDRFWKVNAMPGILELEPWLQGRKRYVDMWDKGFTGSYNWTVKFWRGIDWEGKDYWNDNGVGNLSAVLMWPHETGILSTIRLEAMRDGLEDNALLWMLRDKVETLEGQTLPDPDQAAALADARALCNAGPLAPTLDSEDDLDRLRLRVIKALSTLNRLSE